MGSRIVKIALACCVIAFAAFWLFYANDLKDRAPDLARRFESVRVWSPMLKAAGGAYDTTDYYLKPLEIPRPSETLLNTMAEIPPDDAVIFIGDGEQADLIHHTISHLGWPRRIGEVRCGAAGAPTELMYLPPAGEPVKWLMFYRGAPHPDLNRAAKKIGPHLILTPAPELKEWKSYCSR